ncbi:hypothetical protein [Streptomyces sp. NPDC056061]
MTAKSPVGSATAPYARSLWPVYYRQLGEITRRVHDVHGPAFGPVTGPT